MGEGGGTWVVTIGDGRLDVERTEAERDDVTLTIRADAGDYLKIANGELSGVDAFTTQRLTIAGDLSQAAELANLGLM